uniref:Rhodanese domain-containing protein n=1 Tax=Ditylenchus dipsaci TaxID=166011 RepID=A0A915D185_9BILA
MVFEFPSQSRWAASTSPFGTRHTNRFAGSSQPASAAYPGSIGRLSYLNNNRSQIPRSYSPPNRAYHAANTLPYSTVHDFHRGNNQQHNNRNYSPTDCYEDLDFFYERPPGSEAGHKEQAKNPTKCGIKLYLLVACLVFVSLLLACSIIGFLWYTQERQNQSRGKQQDSSSRAASFSMDKILGVLSSAFQTNKSEKEGIQEGGIVQKSSFNYSLYGVPPSLLGEQEWEEKGLERSNKVFNGGTEASIEPNHLLTLLITKRKVCIFEASTSEVEVSRQEFRSSHLPTARLLLFSSLSHNGVPVHPLQFQRYVRSLGLDQHCHIVIYSRHELIFATYGFWIFKLYGHSKVSILNGGFQAWKSLADQGKGPYTLENSASGSLEPEKLGDFKARWEAEYIATFDDVFANFESHDNDLVDAQSEQEFQGKSKGPVIFGHIRTAMNIPSQKLIINSTWLALDSQQGIFHSNGLNEQRPVIVYDGTSIHSTMVWFGLHRLGYRAAVYFGSWPEWIIRAPDYLKVIPSGE